MRSLNLAKSGLNKVRAQQKELKPIDLDDSIKSVAPGEWCVFVHPGLREVYVGFVNPLLDEKLNCIQLLLPMTATNVNGFSAESFIKSTLHHAFEKRRRFKDYEEGCRIFYGTADGLPGLSIDRFETQSVIQINTAGVDRYREHIKACVESEFPGKAYFLDNLKYREKESLPVYSTEPVPQINIIENGLKYELRAEVMQKVGFYYDHRENRFQLMSYLQRLNKKFEKAIDLFCYTGAWGMSALKGGCAVSDFVDQGDFAIEVKRALELNGFQNRGTFYRADVFKFLDDAIAKKQTYDLVLCDPPAFAKSFNQKDQALDGYSKLHRKVFKIAPSGGMIAFSSCTHYVSAEEFQKNIQDAAQKESRSIQLIYSGIQGWDHPVTSLQDKSNYIKSYFYLMEN